MRVARLPADLASLLRWNWTRERKLAARSLRAHCALTVLVLRDENVGEHARCHSGAPQAVPSNQSSQDVAAAQAEVTPGALHDPIMLNQHLFDALRSD